MSASIHPNMNVPTDWTVVFPTPAASVAVPSPFLVALADLVDAYDEETQRVPLVAIRQAQRVLGRPRTPSRVLPQDEPTP